VPLFDNYSRDELRALYVKTWQKAQERLPLDPLESQIADVVAMHPEYHAELSDTERAMQKDYSPEGGESNPFMHMGLHLAIGEQVSTDRPQGIRGIHEKLTRQTGSQHDAEHLIAECLAEQLWQAQRSGLPPNEHAYLAAVRRHLKRAR
jgi:Domain of unknown function (DUF1841)